MGKAATDAKSRVGERRRSDGRRSDQESRADRARRRCIPEPLRRSSTSFWRVVAGAGVGALLVLVGRGSPAPAPAWSAWEPTGSAERRAAQIGDHVGDQYRLPSGKPLVAVTYAGPPQVTGPDGSSFQVRAIAVRPDTTARSRRGRTTSAPSTRPGRSCTRSAVSVRRARSPKASRASPADSCSGARRSSSRCTRSTTSTESTRRSSCFLRGRTARRPRPSSSRRVTSAPALGRPLDETLTAPLTPGVGEIQADEQRVDRAHDPLTHLRVQLPPGAGREPRHGAHARREWLAATSRPRSSAPRPGSTRSTTTPSRFGSTASASYVAPWFFRIPGFRRYHGYAFWRTILLKHADTPGRPDHARALPRVAGPAPRAAHVVEARDDALPLEPVRDRGAARRGRDAAPAVGVTRSRDAPRPIRCRR